MENEWWTYAAKKDYIEYLVLYHYGGVFMDTDFVCLKPFDELAYRYSYFSGFEPPSDYIEMPLTSNALIATVKESPIMKK